MGVDRHVGQELAYVKAAGVGNKISERSEPPLSYPWEDRTHGGIRLPDWYEGQLRLMRRVWQELDRWCFRDSQKAGEQLLAGNWEQADESGIWPEGLT